MAKFRLSTATIFKFTTFDTTPVIYDVPCPTGITFDETMDTYISDCAANAVKQHVLGAMNISGSFSGEVENDEDLTLVEPGTEVELLLQPTGLVVGNLQVTADLLKITGRSSAASSTGLTTYNCSFVMHDITLLAVPASVSVSEAITSADTATVTT